MAILLAGEELISKIAFYCFPRADSVFNVHAVRASIIICIPFDGMNRSRVGTNYDSCMPMTVPQVHDKNISGLWFEYYIGFICMVPRIYYAACSS